MPLASRGHVLIAVEPDLHGALVFFGGNGGNGRPLVGLCFLATETAAHAAHFHGDGMARNAQCVRHQMLCLARALGGAIDGHILIFARNRQRDLPFQIEMVLTAQIHTVPDAVRGSIDGCAGIAALQR
ncbi:hypothetical protein C038_00299 [Brucella sp. 63/311]|nr:hypothetical protein C038_00299 [Brucella sp. 63/311]